MKSNDIDRLFDESMNRVNKRSGPLSGSYDTSPLAADHLLLKRSWEYFRHRMAALEDQWKKILESKDIEIKALTKEMDLIKEREGELKTQNEAFRAFELEYGRSKANDYLLFEKRIRQLRETWEAEREAINRKEEDFAGVKTSLEMEIVKLKDELAARQKGWERERDAMHSQLNTILEQQKKMQQQWSADVTAKEEETLSLNAKVDLLRPEIERRDQRIQQLKEDLRNQEIQKDELTRQAADLVRKNREQEEQILRLSERYSILEREKESIRESWSREQAEWRELWDRERELWERKAHEKNDFVDNK